MSHFYGTLQGTRGEATRCGTKNSGMVTHCASFKGAVRCRAYIDDGIDMVQVDIVPWQGHGDFRLLYDGPISGEPATT